MSLVIETRASYLSLSLFTIPQTQSSNTIYRSNRCAAISPLHRHVSRSLNKSDPSVGAIGRKRDDILNRHGASECKLRRAVSGVECHCWWLGGKRNRAIRGDDHGRDGRRQGELTWIVGANRRGDGRAPMASMSATHATSRGAQLHSPQLQVK